MQRATPLDTSLRAYSSGGSRGIVQEVDKKRKDDNTANPPEKEGDPDETFMQELKISMMQNEERHNVEHPQNYGFTSHSIKADKPESDSKEDQEKAAAAEHFVQFMGGNRSFPVVQNLDDRRVRLRHLAEGEVCVYDDQQQKLHIKRGVVETRSQFKIEHKVILDQPKQDGHGWHKVASRDQTKDKSIPLTTLTLDPNGVNIERTKPVEEKQKHQEEKNREKQKGEWQKDGEKGKAEKIQKCSSLQMGEKNIKLTTYNKNGSPHLVIELDEDTSQINLMTLDEGRPRFEMNVNEDGFSTEQHEREEENKPGLVFELDDKFRRVLLMTVRDEKPQLVLELDGPKDKLTIKTNGKTEQVFDNASSTIHIHADTVVKIGDRGADMPVAILGSKDSMGHVIVGACATKVLAK